MTEPTTDNRPNILFICVDQWRADALGCTGHPVAETPHLDRLAQEGTLFTQAYAATPTCVPARATIFTGLSPRHTGFVGYNDHIDWRYDVTMAGLLADAGYHTQCVGKMHTQPARNLMGFHNVILHDGYLHRERAKRDDYGLVDDYTLWLRERIGPQADYIDSGVGCNGYAARPWPYDEMLHPTSWVTSRSIDFLRRRDPTKPFFLMMSYHRPHPPLDPPASFLERYRDKPLPDPLLGDWAPDTLPLRGFDSPVPTDPAQRDYARRAYYAQITHIDYSLNRMFQALFENGVLDNTAIVFTADHGEMLYDHNHIAKGYPYDSSARLPFILRLPQSRNVHQAGRATEPIPTVNEVVELRDLLPTFCDLAGIPAPAHVDGRSVLPLLRGESAGWREVLHGEHFLGEDSNQWLTDGHEKYIWFSQTGRELLFDLDEDPTELHNLAETAPERLSRWRERLVAELDGREEGFAQDGRLMAGRPQGPTLADAGVYRAR